MSNNLPSYQQLASETNNLIKLDSKVLEYRKLASKAQTPEDAANFDQIAENTADQADLLRMKIDQERKLIADTASQDKTNTVKDRAKSEALKVGTRAVGNLVKSTAGRYVFVGLLVVLVMGLIVSFVVSVTNNPENFLTFFKAGICEKLGQTDCTTEAIQEIGKKTANDIGLRTESN